MERVWASPHTAPAVPAAEPSSTNRPAWGGSRYDRGPRPHPDCGFDLPVGRRQIRARKHPQLPCRAGGEVDAFTGVAPPVGPSMRGDRGRQRAASDGSDPRLAIGLWLWPDWGGVHLGRMVRARRTARTRVRLNAASRSLSPPNERAGLKQTQQESAGLECAYLVPADPFATFPGQRSWLASGARCGTPPCLRGARLPTTSGTPRSLERVSCRSARAMRRAAH